MCMELCMVNSYIKGELDVWYFQMFASIRKNKWTFFSNLESDLMSSHLETEKIFFASIRNSILGSKPSNVLLFRCDNRTGDLEVMSER